MTFTSPFTAVTGAIITAAGWNTSGRDNINHLRGIIPDPGSSAGVLKRATDTTGTWGQVAAAEIANGAVGTNQLAGASVTSTQMTADAIAGVHIQDGAVGTNKIADSAVTSAKIADGTIATGDIADGAVTSAKIADGTIATGDVADSAVTTAKIADSNVTFGKIASAVWMAPKTATQSADLTLTTSYSDAASLSVTLDRNGKWLVIAQVDLFRSPSGSDVNPVARLLQDGTTPLGPPGAISNAVDEKITVPLVGVATVTGGTGSVKIQGKKDSGSGASTLSFGYLTAIWISS